MQKYKQYKDSGIQWIGEIPAHWEVVPMRFLLRERITDGPHETPQFISEGIPFLSVDGIQDGELVFEGCRKISKEDHEKYKQKCVVEKHDILMGKAASVGKVARVKVDFEFSIWSPLALLKPDHTKITSTYFEYFLKSNHAKDNANILSTFNTQQNISMTDIPRIYFVIPASLAEQTAIAAYLDRKTAELDELIADKKRLLELYEEEKTAIINQAVTKGIQPHVPMKDSGIEWLGEIPAHWEVTSLKRLVETKITDGPHETPTFLPEGVPFISAEAIKNGKIDFNYVRGFISKEDDIKYSKKCKPKQHDIFIVKSGSTTGKIALVDCDVNFNIWSPLALVRVNKKVHFMFMYYALQSTYFQDSIKLFWSYGTQPNIGMNVIENLKISFPPNLDEQLQIVKHLKEKTEHIDYQKSRIEQLLDLLSEYRTALISEVVTGKVKVTD